MLVWLEAFFSVPASMPTNVRCYSNSDRILRRSEMTLCANSRHWACNAKQQMRPQIYGGLRHTAPWAFADSALSALDQRKPPLAYFMTSPGNQSDSAGI